MDLEHFHEFVTSHPGVRRTPAGGAAPRETPGRLVARELDAAHVAVRVPFDVRDALLNQHPDVFSVPPRFSQHMIVVADLDAGDDRAVEDAVSSAWRMQGEHIDNGLGGQSDDW